MTLIAHPSPDEAFAAALWITYSALLDLCEGDYAVDSILIEREEMEDYERIRFFLGEDGTWDLHHYEEREDAPESWGIFNADINSDKIISARELGRLIVIHLSNSRKVVA